MDALVISHTSALRAIRYARQTYSALNWRPLGKVEQRRVLASCSPGCNDIDFDHLEQLGIWSSETSEQLDVLVSSSKHRGKNKRVDYHVISTALPYGALAEIKAGVYATSPAFTALLYLRGRSFAEAVMLLLELTGTYTLPSDATPSLAWHEPDLKSSGIEQAHYRCEPVATVKELKLMAKQTTSSSDRAFRQAAEYIAEGSASPAESLCFAMLSLPLRYGGFGCGGIGKGFRLNHTVRFDDDARAMASGMPYAVCDAYLEDAGIDIEYNGIGHEAENARIHDGQRNNGLKAMGITVIVVNRDQMRDIAALEAIARELHQRANSQLRYRFKGCRQRQGALLNGLRCAIGLPPA